ncbi:MULTISPECIES: nucleotidyltransferase domain-containing protein [Pseudomonas]|uniref:nucleotidyltransferase family protein n=1 Tax=Pseudomonas TaxID=286 RepID=UPI00157319DA|nr:putative nucleotidyltransferase [Pseudomonas sp. M2]NSX19105.1 nucleotidyltransferase domain-containing protein [Pseudomonas putida]HDS1743933.1 nucleotidyltransferase domain-containing protein [Pseudomonas putida]
MKPSDAIQGKTQQIRQAVEACGFVNVRMFGSVCRGEDIEGSDLDLLVTIPAEREGKISLFDILDLESTLEEMLGIPIDLNVANNMPEHLKPEVERSAIPL